MDDEKRCYWCKHFYSFADWSQDDREDRDSGFCYAIDTGTIDKYTIHGEEECTKAETCAFYE